MASDVGRVRPLGLVGHAEDDEQALRSYRDVLGMPGAGVQLTLSQELDG